MTDKKPVIVYGASGYTGRLVCEYSWSIPVLVQAYELNQPEKRSNAVHIATMLNLVSDFTICRSASRS